MKKTLLIIAAALVAAGLTIFFVALATSGFDFTKLNDEDYEEKT